MKTRLLAAMLMALMALALGLAVGCEQTTGPENQQGAEQPAAEESPGTTYVGATEDGTPVELTIEDGTYAVTVGGEEVSRGTATEAADGTWTLQPEGGEAFTAKADEDGLTIKGPITDELDGEDLRELYPVAPPAEVAADYRVSLNAPAVHVFPAKKAGYAEKDVKALSVIITNTGNKATGKLTLEVSNAVPDGGFTLNKETIASIAAGKKAAFTVKPVPGLEAGVYTAKVTVSGGNGISAGFNVRFTVNEADEPDEPVDPPEEPVYGIELDAEGDYTFPDAVEGYDAREPMKVTIINTGNQETGELTLKVSNAVPSGGFTLSKQTIDSIAVEGEDSFTVVPAGGLGKGSYTATVTVSGENIEEQSFEVSFAVNIAPVYGIELSEKGTLVFDDAILGYDARPERTITITNIGNSPTGNLRATLDGADSGFFTRTPPVPNDITENGGTAAFYVRANTGLGVGTYTATVTVSGENVASASFNVSFTVKPVPTHGISLSSDGTAIGASYTHQFGTVTLPNYSQPAPLAVTVANSGNQPTGGLAIGVTGAGFTLSKLAIDSLAVDGTAEFTVVPKTDLSAGTHTATITVSGGNGGTSAPITASFGVSFEVKPVPVYGISLSETGTYPFPSAILGYSAQAEVPVAVSNTGNQPTGVLAIGLTGTGSGSFTLDKQTITDIAAGSSGSFTVVPKTGLSEGTHTATVTVSGGNGIFASFNVSFEVTASYGITLDVEGEYPFPGAILGYGAQGAKTVTISNIGNQSTGNLTLNVSTTDFVLDPPTTVASIAVGTTGSFTVTPALGLSKGPHSATVTVSGGSNIEEQSFNVSFEVTATYGVALSRNGASIGAGYTHPFGTVTLPNYTLPAALAVTVANTGNQPTGALTVSLGGTNSDSFTVTQPNPSSIAVGTAGSFTITPAPNLAAGPHSATVTVNGDNGIGASFGVSLTVNPPQTFAGLITHLNGTANIASASYTLPSGNETYTTAVTLTTANSPATVVIDGGGRVITGGTNSITVGAGVSLTLKNITFTTLPLTVAAGGTLILGNEGDAANSAVVRDNAGTGITVSGTLEMNAGALVTANNASGIRMNGTGARFTMDGGTITGNYSDHGGGVKVDGGIFTMEGGLISANTVLQNNEGGGGVALTGADTEFIMNGGEISGHEVGNANGGGVMLIGDRCSFTMNDGVIRNNSAVWGGGGVYMSEFMTAAGLFTMNGGVITENTAHYGGSGVEIYAVNGRMIMTDGEISHNTSNTTGGGGVLLAAANTKFTMYDGLISENSNGSRGGGVYLWGANSEFTMEGGLIWKNTSGGAGGGGGVYLWGQNSVFYMIDGEISANSAPNGGGVTLWQGQNATFNMMGGIIKNNTAINDGGGLYVLSGNTFNMTGGEVTGNTGPVGGGLYLSGILLGNPSIGSKAATGGSIYNNTPNNRN